MHKKMILVPVSSYKNMYENNVLFHNRKSYFDLKPHNNSWDSSLYKVW